MKLELDKYRGVSVERQLLDFNNYPFSSQCMPSSRTTHLGQPDELCGADELFTEKGVQCQLKIFKMTKKVSFNSTPIWIPANFNLHPICEAPHRSRSLPNIAIEGSAQIDPLYSIERLSGVYNGDLRDVVVTGKSLGSPLHRQIRPFFAMWRVRLNTATSRRAINHGRRRKSPSELAITPPSPPLQLRVTSHIIDTLYTDRRCLRIVESGCSPSLHSLNAFADSHRCPSPSEAATPNFSAESPLATTPTPSVFVDGSVIVENVFYQRQGERWLCFYVIFHVEMRTFANRQALSLQTKQILPKIDAPTLPSPRRRRGKLHLRGRWIGCFPTRPKMGRTTRRLPVALRKMTPSPTTNPLSLQLNNQPDERLLLKQKVPSPFSTTNKEWLHRIGGRQEAEDTKLSSSQCCTPPSPIQQVNKGDKMPQR